MRRRFDVNDAALREAFLRDDVPLAVADLREDTPARWGKMTAPQMVEHLLWGFEISTGRGQVECTVRPEELERMKRFLYSNRPTPQDFMNPVLVSGLPPLRFADLSAAKQALENLLHPMIREESARRIATASGPYVVHVVPLLIESADYRSRVDRVLVVPPKEKARAAQ